VVDVGLVVDVEPVVDVEDVHGLSIVIDAVDDAVRSASDAAAAGERSETTAFRLDAGWS